MSYSTPFQTASGVPSMLLTISTTHQPATDLGFLLHKNPARSQSLDLAFGQAHIFYPEATETRCTLALLLDLNPVELVRGGEKGGSGLMDQYVNDRPYAASSFLSVAIARALRTALGGRSDQRPDLAAEAIPLDAMVTPLPVRGEVGLITRLFEPLGYEIEIEPIPLDEVRPEWGMSAYVTLRLSATCRLADLLNHLYVLIPVLDLKKHYFIQREELEKLLDKGGEWLRGHPHRQLIARRYLRRKRSLANEAIIRLAEADGVALAEDEEEQAAAEAPADLDAVPEEPKNLAEEALEKPLRLHEQRHNAVIEVLKASGARSVVDLGCGSAKETVPIQARGHAVSNTCWVSLAVAANPKSNAVSGVIDPHGNWALEAPPDGKSTVVTTDLHRAEVIRIGRDFRRRTRAWAAG
jgi:3' terminal RNA ribose 2'-O-methyltransferase Hen1